MLPSTSVTVIDRAQSRPRARSIGVTLIIASAIILPFLLVLPNDGLCGAVPFLGTSASVMLVGLIAIAGVVLTYGVPRMSAVAPALSLGAGTLLLGGAAAGWTGLVSGACLQSVLHAPASLLVIQGGVALAVIFSSAWLLFSRDELEPWGGAQGVVVSAAAAVGVLAVGVGFAAVVAEPAQVGGLALVLGTVLPWAMLVGLTGWLRSSPALALMTGVAVQAVWLLIRFT